MNDTNPVQIQSFLGGVNYPASKQEILEKARGNEAPEDVINALENLPETEYRTPADLSKDLGR